MSVLGADELGVPILRALGIDGEKGIVSMVLTIRANQIPTLVIERYMRNAGGMHVVSDTDPKKLETELTRYELKLKKEEK